MIGLWRRLRRIVIPRQFHPYTRAERDIVRQTKGRVIVGPFAGQVYQTCAADYVDPEMLLGIYECEIEAIISGGADVVIDIGSAQGYYVIGLARQCPGKKVIGFEVSQAAIDQFERTALANEVRDRTDLRGNYDPQSLAAELEGFARPVVLMAVDGYEEVLLDPVRVPAL